ncbi:MAG TPA: hypothetical protein VFK69_13640 [Candidatus Eisenbacteria bacterium]|nr:hypothetical protein [Candidatus Eisenbacteria bacterium]
MRRNHLLGLAAAVALLAGCAGPITYNDRYGNDRYGGRSFTGTWQIDPSRSDNPQTTYRGDDSRSRDQDSDRDEDNRDRDRSVRFRSAWNDMGRMPDVIRIDGGRGRWTIRDTDGGVVEEIAMQDRDQDYGDHGDNGDVAIGQWRNGQLVVERDRNGRGYTQTFTLQDRGRVLMVRTDVAGPNGSRSYVRVYDRVS